MFVAFGAGKIVNGVPGSEVDAPGVLGKVSCTDDSPVWVPVAIIVCLCSALRATQVLAAVPELGVAPTLTRHCPEIKLVP